MFILAIPFIHEQIGYSATAAALIVVVASAVRPRRLATVVIQNHPD